MPAVQCRPSEAPAPAGLAAPRSDDTKMEAMLIRLGYDIQFDDPAAGADRRAALRASVAAGHDLQGPDRMTVEPPVSTRNTPTPSATSVPACSRHPAPCV